MDQCTHDIRATHWKNIIQNCKQRPAGQSVRQWLGENDILEQSYYYWQRKFRNEAYDHMNKACLPSAQDADTSVSFVEISEPVHQEASSDSALGVINPTAVIKSASVSIAISNNISEHLLSKILQEVAHA